MSIRMRHQFVCLLARRIHRDRVVDIVAGREWQFGIGAIDRRRRREHEMLAAVMAAAFQHVQKALEIGVEIGFRMGDRMSHAGLGCEMHHMREFVFLEQLRRRGAVGKIEPDEFEMVRLGEFVAPRFL